MSGTGMHAQLTRPFSDPDHNVYLALIYFGVLIAVSLSVIWYFLTHPRQ